MWEEDGENHWCFLCFNLIMKRVHTLKENLLFLKRMQQKELSILCAICPEVAFRSNSDVLSILILRKLTFNLLVDTKGKCFGVLEADRDQLF